MEIDSKMVSGAMASGGRMSNAAGTLNRRDARRR